MASPPLPPRIVATDELMVVDAASAGWAIAKPQKKADGTYLLPVSVFAETTDKQAPAD